MTLQDIKENLESAGILFSEDPVAGRPAIVGYDKKFKWQWAATQLNTFLVAMDLGTEPVSVQTIEAALAASFEHATRNYTGWPRGLQSGLGVITILVSSRIDADAAEYCRKLKSGKRWAGFAVPVAVDSISGHVHSFDQNPLWGRIYYPYFKELIDRTLVCSGGQSVSAAPPCLAPQATNDEPAKNTPESLPPYAHAIAGWPLVMVVIGGGLGGLCGGGAYGLSLALLKKKGVTPLSCIASLLIGIAGVGLYCVAVAGLAQAVPGLFGPK